MRRPDATTASAGLKMVVWGDAGGYDANLCDIKGPLGGCEQTGAVEPVKLQGSEVSALWLAGGSSFSDKLTRLQRWRS